MIARAEGFLRTSDGEDIWYETAGEGPPLVLCHGLGGNTAVWFQQVPHFADRYRVISWDQRGFGRSSNTEGRHGPVTAVADLRALLDHLGVERCVVVGQSMGGWAALGAALQEPDRVAAVVLASTTGGVRVDDLLGSGSDSGGTPARQVGTPVGQVRTPVAPAATVTVSGTAAHGAERSDQAEHAPQGQPSHPAPPDRPGQITDPTGARPLGVHPAIGERLATVDPARAYLYQTLGTFGSRPPDSEFARLLMETSYGPEALATMTQPTLVVCGELDPLMTPPLVRAAASRLPRAEVVELAGRGHSPYFEDPDQWNELVDRFLRAEFPAP